ncbi:hypothetical protein CAUPRSCDRAFT_12218 [Caulochytrium protostelioides]|uniref:Uncharacterized protein n=1 Tax=Caulochytrium protostelioides TaxID=1555241 RepID=A0A4P9WTR8_9FUNG|nr:hypothetical protein CAUPRSCDRAFT_12218 [Caulochytrium protostelioides]
MEPLLAKLHVLDYVGAFCKPNDIDPFHKFYFTIPSDQPSEQLHHFGALFAWLSTLLGKPFDVPSEFDDPNATAANIVQQCKVLGVSLEQGPNKVKQAYGDVVLSILDTLTSKALAKRNFKPEAPSFPNDK